MRLISLDSCEPGIVLGKSIFNDNGQVLLSEGTVLSEKLIDSLKKYNILMIYIEDEESEGIEIFEAIPDELRFQAISTIKEGFQTIAELNSDKSKIQGMLKSGRAIRSFQKVFRDIIDCLKENQHALNLLATTKVLESYVFSHSVNVSIYACQLAIEHGLPIRNIEEIGLGAMLHDFGKLYVEPAILNKPGRLTNEEYEHIKTHTELGFETLRKIHEIPLPVAHCALQHHERIDGTGYPRGLTDEEIHKYAKILSVADVFDAVTSPRVYRNAMLPHQGLELLYTGSGTQFESNLVELFKGCIAIYPPGMTVTLNDGRTGIVSKYDFNAAGRPRVRIIKDEEMQKVEPYEIDLSERDQLTISIVKADALL